ncbi:MAG: hypothetical protein WCA21_06935 [Terracidiphilus sp.]|jgi:hypothetical protein
MKHESIIKTCITPYFKLVIDNEDGTEKVWKLCYDYRSIALIEDATGLDLKKIESWKSISSGKQFPQVVHGGLHRYNPEVTLNEVLDMLNPQAQRLLSDEIFNLMFPGVVEAWNKSQQQGEVPAESPNAETPATD